MFRSGDTNELVELFPVRYEDAPDLLPPYDEGPEAAAAVLAAGDDPLRRILERKPREWSDEEEVRVVRGLGRGRPVNVGRDDADLPILLFAIPPESVATIVLGARSGPQLESLVREHCKSHSISPRLQRAVVPVSSYDMQFVDI